MAKRFSMGDVAIDVAVKQGPLPAPDLIEPAIEPDLPFRILVLGNFSGRGDGKSGAIEVDRDNLDDVIAQLRVQANVGFANGAYPLPLRSIEDFEPDTIARKYELFQALRKGNASKRSAIVKTAPQRQPDLEADAKRLTSGSLLDEILAKQNPVQQESPSRAGHEGGDDLQSIINRAIEPDLLRQDPEASKQSEEQQRKQELLMRAVLRDKSFRLLEANWRSLEFLVRRLETDASLKLFLFDISKENLATELIDSSSVHSGATYRAIVEDSSTTQATQWAVIVGLFEFDRNTRRDVELLGNLGLLARAARAPFIAECSPENEGMASDSEAWQALRESSHASWLGLGIPRFLLRLPYGKDTTPVESFPFEEMPNAPEHAFYLWANPAIACAYLLGASFAEAGWSLRPGMHRDIEDLPLHILRRGGVVKAQPCAEVLLNDSSLEHLLESGLIPLATERDRDIIRVVRFQSIADPPASLSGRWA